MRRLLTPLCFLLAPVALLGCADTSDPIRVVGSSTVYPFAVRAAERFSQGTGETVVIEQTGSGGGHKLFCAPGSSVDATTSSRRRLPEERDLCAANGRSDVLEIALGYDSIVLAQSGQGTPFALDLRDLWRAVAARVPDASCALVPNPAERWSDIDPALPNTEIEIHGPPPTSGTRDAFVTLALQSGAMDDPCMAALANSDPVSFDRAIAILRRDGRWVDAGENDNTLIQTLQGRPTAFGVMGQSSLARIGGRIRTVPLDGLQPGDDYPLKRKLYFYLDANAPPSLKRFGAELISDDAEGAYLRAAGLLPLPEAERAAMQARLAGNTPR